MRDRYSKKVDAFLRIENKNLNNLFEKIMELQELNKRFALYLPPEMHKYCQVANRIENRLVIIAANGSIATQLRFQNRDLVRKFKQDYLLSKIQDIQCKVRPIDSSQFLTPATKKIPLLSTATAKAVKAIADSLKDAKLREVMQRIATHTKS